MKNPCTFSTKESAQNYAFFLHIEHRVNAIIWYDGTKQAWCVKKA